MPRRSALIALLPGACLVSAGLAAGLLGYRINLTPSLPPGLWQRVDADRAAYVEFCLPAGRFAELVSARGYLRPGSCPHGLAPLLKPVAAREGDTVEVTSRGLSVNGRPVLTQPAAAFDSQGRPLAAIAPGRYRVPAQTLWVVSSHHPRSLDSRYFGPVPASSVRSGMVPVLVFKPRGNHAPVHR